MQDTMGITIDSGDTEKKQNKKKQLKFKYIIPSLEINILLGLIIQKIYSLFLGYI